jgi:predicted MFS family arabinose efflux permease
MKRKQILAFGLICCLLYGIGADLRSDIGILIAPLQEHTSLRYDQISLCIAIMQLVFGAAQPLFGILASKKSNRFVLRLGALLLALSLGGLIFTKSFVLLLFWLGIVFGLGAGALAFGLILSSAIRFVGQENAMIISGMLNAASGMLGFILSPAMQAMIDASGLVVTLCILAALCIGLLPVVQIVTKKDESYNTLQKDASSKQNFNVKQLLHAAMTSKTYLLLLAGFATCGFHMVIIESHLFSQYVLFGIDTQSASWCFSIYGAATIFGALLSGYLCTRVPKGKLLSFYFGFRAVWVWIYIWLMPKNIFTSVLFSIGLGLSGDATVSPVSGLVSENFSIEYVATLVGLLFFVHQIGAFFSAWAGGLIREITGGYTLVWMLDIVFCLAACFLSFIIPKKTSPKS